MGSAESAGRRQAAAALRGCGTQAADAASATTGEDSPLSGESSPGAPATEHLGPRYDSLIAYETATPAAPPSHTLEAEDSDREDPEEHDEFGRKLDTVSTEPGVYLLKDRNG